MTTVRKPLLIYGAGSFARELAWVAGSAVEVPGASRGEPAWSVMAFIDDAPHPPGFRIGDLPVLTFEEASRLYPGAAVAGGIGKAAAREKTMELALAAGFVPATVIHHGVEFAPSVYCGAGTVIFAGTVLTTEIRLGRQVQLNLGCTIAHEVVLGDYTTLAPGVHISGCVHVGKRVHFGTGAVVVNGTASAPLLIGDDAVIGAGACVTKPVPAGLTVVGVPARPLAKALVLAG